MATDEPFAEAVQALLGEHDISQRELIRRTRRHGWGSPGTISFLMREHQLPTKRAMEAIAQAMQVEPEHFAEYRLHRARESLDPAEVGLEQALRNLAALEQSGVV